MKTLAAQWAELEARHDALSPNARDGATWHLMGAITYCMKTPSCKLNRSQILDSYSSALEFAETRLEKRSASAQVTPQ